MLSKTQAPKTSPRDLWLTFLFDLAFGLCIDRSNKRLARSRIERVRVVAPGACCYEKPLARPLDDERLLEEWDRALGLLVLLVLGFALGFAALRQLCHSCRLGAVFVHSCLADGVALERALVVGAAPVVEVPLERVLVVGAALVVEVGECIPVRTNCIPRLILK